MFSATQRIAPAWLQISFVYIPFSENLHSSKIGETQRQGNAPDVSMRMELYYKKIQLSFQKVI